MAFDGPGKSPWEKKGSSPPNVEEFLNLLQSKFRLPHRPNLFNIWLLLAVVLLIWVLSGIFIVDPQEQAAVLRFGRLVRIVGPGPNYHLPYPIEKVLKERVTEVKRLEIGFRTINTGPPAQYRDVPRESLMLTGDESIVDVQFIVQYVISDLPDFLFNARDVHGTVRSVAESAMREVIGKNNIDRVLTEGKGAIETAARDLLASILANYRVGVRVQNVKLQDVQPPETVAEAFKAVASAREERERLINDAEGYSNDLLPKAKGQAEQILNQAKAYAAQRVNLSQGEAKRFLALLAEYRKAREVTRDRIRIETMEAVLPKVNKIIVDKSVGKNIFPLVPLNQATAVPSARSAPSAPATGAKGK